MDPSSTFQQREKRVNDIARTDYHWHSNAAAEYLAALEGANINQQKELFARILQNHTFLGPRKQARSKKPSMPDKEWKKRAVRLADMVESWARRALQKNEPLAETAAHLWDNLTLQEGEDRCVALALLLKTPLVPYAHIPDSLIHVSSRDVYEEAAVRIAPTLVTATRILTSSSITPTEVAEGLARLSEELKDDHEARVVLFIQLLSRPHSCGSPILSSLLERLSGLVSSLHLSQMDPDSTEPDEDEGKET